MDSEARQNTVDFKQLFGSEQGKRVQAKLISLSNYKYVRVGDSIDSHRLAFDEGQRSVVCYIINKVESKLDEPEEENTVEKKE